MGKNQYLGVDIGGTGIKAALIDTKAGRLLTERYRIPTPFPATPKSVAAVIGEMVAFFDYKGPIGCGFPAIIHHGVAKSAANIDKKWIGQHVEKLFGKATNSRVYVANDADVAGLAEVAFGHAKDIQGLVIVLTIGTGIGSGMFFDNKLIPNTEFGHLNFRDSVYEKYVSNGARKRDTLTWEEWGIRFNEYLLHLETIFSPDLLVLGGGTSKKFEKFKEYITIKTQVIPALHQNDAGVLGAAMYAEKREHKFLHG
jgi:polyphosphate glucokinase